MYKLSLCLKMSEIYIYEWHNLPTALMRKCGVIFSMKNAFAFYFVRSRKITSYNHVTFCIPFFRVRQKKREAACFSGCVQLSCSGSDGHGYPLLT